MEYLRALLPRITRTQVIIIGLATAPVVLGGAGVLAVLLFLMASGGTVTPAPDQPIAFDHTVHAGEAKIPCEFCHRGGVDSSCSHSTVRSTMHVLPLGRSNRPPPD